MAAEREEFTVTLSLPDGRYLYRFQVDDHQVPDPRSPHQLVVTESGIASVLYLQRWRRTARVQNHRKAPVTLQVRPSQPWLHVTPTELTLPGLASAELLLELRPSDMTP